MKNLLLVIPAIKKNAIIPDQLVKKLNGITLIQRAINTALKLTNNILIITDSQEISLIAKRNGIRYHYDTKLRLNSQNIIETTLKITEEFQAENIFLYRANTPLITSEILLGAYKKFKEDLSQIVVSVKTNKKGLLKLENGILVHKDGVYLNEIKAFYIFNKKLLNFSNLTPFVIEKEKSIEILGYQDWWVCEKILNRKCIVFNIIGNTQVGSGHIYRARSLAHEITDHEIIFLCSNDDYDMVSQIISKDYRVIKAKDVLAMILKLRADLVINDCLNTQDGYICELKSNGIKVVNFEDLGSGAQKADIVFNEIYEDVEVDGDNIKWGYKYFALRDEFNNALSHNDLETIKEVLITFGGTDPNNITLIALKAIYDICRINNYRINIVCGAGYLYKDELLELLNCLEYKNINFTYANEVISQIMEKSQLAITANGRTVYELADMHIPSIVISQHEREATHTFSSLQNGFIHLGVVDDLIEKKIKDRFEKLICDEDYRKLLFLNVKKHNFRKNKSRIIAEILHLLKDEL